MTTHDNGAIATPDWHLPQPPKHCGQLVTTDTPSCPTCGELINQAFNRRAD